MKHSLKLLVLAGALMLTMPMVACSTLEQLGASGIQAAAGPATPAQVTTLAEAINAATLVTEAADFTVKHVKLSNAQLEQLRAANNAVSAALHKWKDAADANQSLLAASFNAALASFNSYRASLPAS